MAKRISDRRRLAARWRMGAAVLLLSFSGAGLTGADVLRPYLTTDQNPFIQIFTLPLPEGAAVLRPGESELTLLLDLTNNSIEEDRGAERVVLDGETYRTSLIYRRGMTERLEGGVILPLVTHQRGVFDHFIEDWHDIFGLSNSERVGFESNSLRYFYQRDGVVQFDIDEPTGGLGDLRLTGAFRLTQRRNSPRRTALRAAIKLPTGEASDLRGSGGTDVSLRLTGTDDRTLERWQTRLSWSFGAVWLGSGDVLPGVHREAVAVGHVGAARPFWRSLVVKAQIDAHSSFYDSPLEVLGAGATQLTVGGGMEFASDSLLDFAIVENLFTDTTPDLVFHLSWRKVL